MLNKTNIDHLRDLIKDNEEAIEFLDAIREELGKAKDKISTLKTEIGERDSEIDMLEEALASDADLEEIDCGIGSIFYREPDNLQLQSLMEDFKEKHQVHL
jgi:predicted RNase H-like nuclease (RuvC/YqgF family)